MKQIILLCLILILCSIAISNVIGVSTKIRNAYANGYELGKFEEGYLIKNISIYNADIGLNIDSNGRISFGGSVIGNKGKEKQ